MPASPLGRWNRRPREAKQKTETAYPPPVTVIMMKYLGKHTRTPEEKFFNAEVYKECCNSWGRCQSYCQVRTRPALLMQTLVVS